jgi:hypothetical protein
MHVPAAETAAKVLRGYFVRTIDRRCGLRSECAS